MKVKNYINGAFVDSKTSSYFDVHNPATGEVIAQTPMSLNDELDQAVLSAKKVNEDSFRFKLSKVSISKSEIDPRAIKLSN